MSSRSDNVEIAVLQTQMEEVKQTLTEIKQSTLRIEAVLPSYLSRAEYISPHQALEGKVDALIERLNTIEGQSSGKNLSWGYLIGGMTAAAAVAALLLNALSAFHR